MELLKHFLPVFDCHSFSPREDPAQGFFLLKQSVPGKPQSLASTESLNHDKTTQQMIWNQQEEEVILNTCACGRRQLDTGEKNWG